MLYNIKAPIIIKEAPQIALTPIFNVSIPPKTAPNKNEKTIVKSRIIRIAASWSFWVKAIYASLAADRKLPVDIVELYGESAILENEHT